MITTRAPNVTRKALPIGNQVLNKMLGIHAADDTRIIDICHNKGAMWQGLSYRPFRVDIEERWRAYVDLVEDWNNLPAVLECAWWYTLVADPYFKEDETERGAHSQYASQRNPFKDGDVEKALGEIFDVARALRHPVHGTLILKIGDQVHTGLRRWQDYLALDIARDKGWHPCDRDVTDSSGPASNTAKRIYHADSLVFWLVFHPTANCPGPGLEIPGRAECAYCGRLVKVTRRRAENYCRPPRRCKQNAYEKRVADMTIGKWRTRSPYFQRR